MSYATTQSIRESAGLLKRAENETPSGIVDGVNSDFTANRKPFVDGNNDDSVSDEDVIVMVNGVPQPTSAINQELSTVTLVTPPAAGSRVFISYYFSPVSDEYVEGKADEADSWIDTKLKGIVEVPFKNNVPGIISTIAELYASGLILTRDYGSKADSENTSRDGRSKIKTARELLDDYIAGVRADENETGVSGNVHVATGDNVFGRLPENYDDCGDLELNDDYFMRRQL